LLGLLQLLAVVGPQRLGRGQRLVPQPGRQVAGRDRFVPLAEVDLKAVGDLPGQLPLLVLVREPVDLAQVGEHLLVHGPQVPRLVLLQREQVVQGDFQVHRRPAAADVLGKDVRGPGLFPVQVRGHGPAQAEDQEAGQGGRKQHAAGVVAKRHGSRYRPNPSDTPNGRAVPTEAPRRDLRSVLYSVTTAGGPSPADAFGPSNLALVLSGVTFHLARVPMCKGGYPWGAPRARSRTMPPTSDATGAFTPSAAELADVLDRYLADLKAGKAPD